MPVHRKCKCGQSVPMRKRMCPNCNSSLTRCKGRPKGTTKAQGYKVSGGRPKGTTEAEGYRVSKSGGRPEGTTEAEGYRVSKSGARPEGTTEAEGYRVSKSGARPEGTTKAEGFNASDGRPKGTTQDAGFKVGGAANADSDRMDLIDFSGCELPSEWDKSPGSVNLTEEMLRRCLRSVVQQRRFDKEALVDAMCWQCGKVLLHPVDSVHGVLVDPPEGKEEQDAPALAYKKALPTGKCNLHFTNASTADNCEGKTKRIRKRKWFACSFCSTRKVPEGQHVGDVFDGDIEHIKPVSQWDMRKPDVVSALQNRRETGMTALSCLFSNTVKEAGFSQWRHVQGEVNAVHKLDRHFYGLFGFLACREESIVKNSPNPASDLRIHNALMWYRKHNHLYTSFFSTFETIFRFVKPEFINPSLLDDQDIRLEDLLQDEAVGMAFPVCAKYFDQFPLIFDGKDRNVVAGIQHPRPECQESLRELVSPKYGDAYLEPKTFPHIYPWGYGGWSHECPLGFAAHIKMRLFDVRGWFAEDPIYPFFMYDYMTKSRLRGYASRRTVRTGDLNEQLNASKVCEAETSTNPYEAYGTQVPRTIPGSLQHWKSFGLDLTAFVEQRGMPDFFVTLSAYDCWPQTQATLADGWGAKPSEDAWKDLARIVEDRHPVGWHPQVSVMSAERRFRWIMHLLLSGVGPLGCVEDYIWKKEYQKRGAVHWHMLLWIKPGTIPEGAIMAEVPRVADGCSEYHQLVARYLRKVVLKMQLHGTCNPNRCFKGNFGKVLPHCKYGFPFTVPQLKEELDEDCVRYLYVRRHHEDRNVVTYNPDLAILWGACHNVQRVSSHGFEQYLAKYISKPEPSIKIDLPENATLPQRYLRTRIIGAVEAIEVLMGFQQSRMTRQVIFLHTEMVPTQRMLKTKFELKALADDSEDIYTNTKYEIYLHRPSELRDITYPDFFRWWYSALSAQQEKAEVKAAQSELHTIRCRSTDDFKEFLCAKKELEGAKAELAERLSACKAEITTSEELLALLRCAAKRDISSAVQNAIQSHYDLELPVEEDKILSREVVLADSIIEEARLDDKELSRDLSVSHWLIDHLPSEALTQMLKRFPPGTMLANAKGHYWVRRASMAITRHRFISPVGDDQEKFYEQKYLLTVPLTYADDIVQNPPQSWLEFCASQGLCDGHLDCISSLQSAISRGFSIEALRILAKVYVDHGFLTDGEAHSFLADIPVLGEKDFEPQREVTDQLLGDPDSDLGSLVPNRPSFCLDDYIKSFTSSQRRAFDWLSLSVDKGKQIQAAIVGPAGTGKSYLLNALIEMMRSKGLVVAKLAPSGVAAHLIGGTTIHNFFALDINCNSRMENGSVHAARLRKTDVLVIDEFSMLDFFLFRTAEALCRIFARKGSSKHSWGGRHVLLLGDPAQLPAVSRKDIFGTTLWRQFTILMLREVKRASDPALASMLAKVRMGICDHEVQSTLQSRFRAEKWNDIDLNKSIVICSLRQECDEINTHCINRIEGQAAKYLATDTDHNGKPLRSADVERMKRCRERLPDELILKVGARVVLRRNLEVESGWVNGTLAVVIAMHENCIVVRKMTNPSQRYPIPRFKQKIEISGASYSIIRRQFPIQLAYAVTVHRVQGLTVQRAIVKLNANFFASGQAYVALSRVRHLDDLVIWDYSKASIFIIHFYKQLLQWCDSVDTIRPIPSTQVVPHPVRADNTSNAPLDNTVEDPSTWEADESGESTTQVPGSKKHPPKTEKSRPHKTSGKESPTRGNSSTKKSNSKPPGRKRKRSGKGNPRTQKANHKRPKMAHTPSTTSNNRSPVKRPSGSQGKPADEKKVKVDTGPSQSDTDNQYHIEFRQLVADSLAGQTANDMLGDLSSYTQRMPAETAEALLALFFDYNANALDRICEAINSFPVPYASQYTQIPLDRAANALCHPILLETLKPASTIGNGNCAFNAISMCLTGSQDYSSIVRLLCAYALFKYKAGIKQAFIHAYYSNSDDPIQQAQSKLWEAVTVAITNYRWGSDHHFFALSWLFNRPIVQYNTFYEQCPPHPPQLTPSNTRDAYHLSQQFRYFEPFTRIHIVYCSTPIYNILTHGNIQHLPKVPLAIFHQPNVHWVAMLYWNESTVPNIPIPRFRLFREC